VFQAEDCIRARNVTGVQTCALPIYRIRRLGALLAAFAATLIIAILLPVTPAAHSAETGRFDTGIRRCTPAEQDAINAMMTGNGRSEERRVGKECRAREEP